ncbi:MAG: penicillin-binding protein activator [Gemmatimonadota bacterium]
MIQRIQRPPGTDRRPGAFGVRAVLFSLVLGVVGTSCTPVGRPESEPTPVPAPIPSIEKGNLPEALEEEAAAALSEARNLLMESSFEEAREAALGIIRHYPNALGSGEAYAILTRASLGMGETGDAVEAVGQYLALFEDVHPMFPEAVVMQAEALAADGDRAGSLSSLLLLPANTAEDETVAEGVGLLREVVGSVGVDELRGILEEIPSPHPFRGVVATELAVSLFLGGETEEARVWAQSALDGELEPRELELCRGVLDGTLEEVLGQPIILGAILPQSGTSPGLIEYGEWVLEGIQVAMEEFQGELRRPIRLEIVDHEGSTERAREAVVRLEEEGVVGIVGPLGQEYFAVSAEARRTNLPVVSPFAPLPVEDAPGALSLSGPDPSGAEVLAQYAWDLGLERVAILRPGTEEARIEAEAFLEAFQRAGGSVAREVVYDSGATFFQAEFEEVGSVLPDGLFLPLPPDDIQLLAPQFTYYGLDTLGIQLLGTAGWTEEEIVQNVDSRHTDGVIASTTRLSQDETEAFRRFRLRYEALFQKSLRSEIPAYGYDAALLLLAGLRENPRNTQELLRAMEGIEDLPGATGHLTVEGDRIRRVPQLVRIQNHEMIYISSHMH